MNDPLPRRIAWFAPWTWKRRWKIATVLLMAFAGYPLSYGPALLLTTEGWIPYPLFRLVYSPLHLCAHHSDQINDALEWYASRCQPGLRRVLIISGDVVLVDDLFD